MIHSRNKTFAAGTAVTEFLVALPLLATVVTFIFFFGWALVHKQQVIMASRYAAWESIYNAAPDEGRVNEVAMAGKAQNLVIRQTDAPVTTTQDLLNRVGQGSLAFASATVGQAFRGGVLNDTAADFIAHRVAWAQFSPTVASHHSRDGVSWDVDEVSCWAALRDVYLSDFNQSLDMIDPVASGMTGVIEGLYLGYWGRLRQ